MHIFQEESFAEVTDGYLDMSGASFDDDRIYRLSGEWRFFPNERILPENIPDTHETQPVPESWYHDAMDTGDNLLGEATYMLTLKLPSNLDSDIGLRFYEINTAAEIYANGELIYTFNDLDTEPGTRGMDYGPVDVSFHPDDADELELLVIVTNHTLGMRGGLERDVLIGSSETIDSIASVSKGLQLAAGLILLLHALYAFVLYVLSRERKNNLLLLFGLMLFMFASGVFLDDEVLLTLPVSLPLSLKILLTVFVLTLYVMFLIVSVIVKLPKIVMKTVSVFFVSYAVVALIFPIDQYLTFTIVTMMMFPLFILTMITLTVRSILHGNQYGYFILAFLLAYTSNSLWGVLIKLNVLQFPFYPADFVFSMMALMGLVLKQHSDITKENRHQANIIIQNEANKDQFLANTAHELRNPLHGMLTITDTILDQLQTKPKEAIREELELNRKIGNQMKFILDDLRDFTLLKESRIRLHPEPVNAASTARTIADILRYQIVSKDVRISVYADENLPMIHADQERFFQIIYNLMHNAVKFTDQGEVSITIAHSNNPDSLSIKITDTGTGIPSSDLDRLMQPYEQGADPIMGGIGLGLNISRELTRLHDGCFTMTSEEGAGTAVQLQWPVSKDVQGVNGTPLVEQPPSTSLEQPAREKEEAKKDLRHLLIVDDDPVNIDLIGRALESDYRITKATSGESALNLLTANQFDLVISDVMMPVMSGYKFTEEIRKQYDLVTLPVLLLTARYHAADIISGFEAGANDYVSKPVEISELKARVKTLTDMKHSAFKQIETEAALLQSQIRPHFLYNTLNAIASLGQTDPDRMTDLLFEFGDYLKFSFRIPEISGLVTLEEEMNLIRPYLFIEQTRFQNRLHVTVDIADEQDIYVPRLAIQTLVENAINHGALKSKGTGEVHFYARRSSEGSFITISDNGPGKAEELRKRLTNETEHSIGIGLVNAHRRMKTINHEGLLIENRPEGGIIIRINLP
ncbi:ATP-binding protein [Salisediminibacterium selenitireducens]|nr:ATP-binding protein [Salisediminibacterium selenitireducens]